MTDPRRLTEEPGNDLSASLLRAAKSYTPSERTKQKTFVALGVAGVATTVSSTAAGAAGATQSSATTKIVAYGLLGLALVGGVVYGLSRRSKSTVSTQLPTTTVVESSAATQQPAPLAQPTVTASPTLTAEASSLPAVPTSGTTSVAPKAPAPSASLGLSDEIKLLDRARSTLASNPQASMAALDEYRKLFPKPTLGLEAQVIRIEALVNSGDRGSARALAKDFLARHASSPHASRIRKLVGLEEGADAGL